MVSCISLLIIFYIYFCSLIFIILNLLQLATFSCHNICISPVRSFHLCNCRHWHWHWHLLDPFGLSRIRFSPFPHSLSPPDFPLVHALHLFSGRRLCICSFPFVLLFPALLLFNDFSRFSILVFSRVLEWIAVVVLVCSSFFFCYPFTTIWTSNGEKWKNNRAEKLGGMQVQTCLPGRILLGVLCQYLPLFSPPSQQANYVQIILL